MSVKILEKYLPEGALPYLRNWFAAHSIHIKITRERLGKLGDYRPLHDHSHRITINSTLPPQLFFFVLTHELAHLHTRQNYGPKVSSHGKEWQHTYRNMLLESLAVYEEALKPAILKYAKSPKANFMLSPELVLYYDSKRGDSEGVFVQDLPSGSRFRFRGKIFEMIGKVKINYLCLETASGKKYSFKPLAKVEKI